MANILLVDDDPVDLEYLRWILETVGHTVTEARDGNEALDALSRTEFDVVVTDILMPHMDGGELVQKMHEGVERLLPIIVISGGGSGDPQTTLRSMEHLGVSATLEKPVRPAVLTDAVRSAREFLTWDI